MYLFCPIPYSFLRQRPQQLADQFAARGLAVTYIEPCGLTEYLGGHKRGLLRLVSRSAWYQFLAFVSLVLPSRARPRGTGISSAAGLSVLTMPVIIPHTRFDSPFLEKMNARVYREVLEREVFARMGAGDHSVAIVENPFWGLVLRGEDFSALGYDCLDEMVLFAGRSSKERYADYERRLLAIAGVTFVTAEQLEEDLRRKKPACPVIRIPNGVDYEWFKKRALGTAPPGDMAAIRPPVAGYVGVLRAWFDYELVGKLAASMPDISFVIVGPLDIKEKIAHLRDLPNLLWLGRRPSVDVPRYIRSFDVCLIPFEGGSVAMTTNPVKIFEYFALGKPVVSTPMRELESFGRDGLLRIAEGEKNFASAIRASLTSPDDALAGRRERVAQDHSWRILADQMMAQLSPGAPA